MSNLSLSTRKLSENSLKQLYTHLTRQIIQIEWNKLRKNVCLPLQNKGTTFIISPKTNCSASTEIRKTGINKIKSFRKLLFSPYCWEVSCLSPGAKNQFQIRWSFLPITGNPRQVTARVHMEYAYYSKHQCTTVENVISDSAPQYSS